MTPSPAKGKRGAVTITLPWPITMNHYRTPIARRFKNKWVGRLITSPKGRKYKQLVIDTIREQGVPSIKGPVVVTERFYCKTNARYDIDNYRKPMRDGIVKAGVIEDDYLIYEDRGIKCPKDKDNPRVEITIEPMEGAA
ncbi:MAG: RusA family crossover junction endodeoxyribonuclease [Phycisphaerales bacterium]|jgi:Holliday junction resolvase RusA-like endonuclease|nr:RusA family crossover junction endodeoxyribonuclease [Phycisphaerales bacterium]